MKKHHYYICICMYKHICIKYVTLFIIGRSILLMIYFLKEFFSSTWLIAKQWILFSEIHRNLRVYECVYDIDQIKVECKNHVLLWSCGCWLCKIHIHMQHFLKILELRDFKYYIPTYVCTYLYVCWFSSDIRSPWNKR